MTQDEHDPTSQTSGSTDSASTSGADSGAPKTTASRPSRRRHTPSRSRQPKETKATKPTKAATETKEQPAEPEPVIAVVEPAPTPVAEVAAQAAPTATATAPVAAESPKRAATRGRRGGANRRRTGKTETPDVQLVPVISAPESDTPTSVENPLELAPLPAPELLPLDTAILAHLDALSQATERQAAEEKAHEAHEIQEAQTSAEEQPPAADETGAPRRYRFDRPRPQAPEATPVRPERLSGWRATPPTLMTPPPAAEVAETQAAPAEPVITFVAPETEVPEVPEVITAAEQPEHDEATEIEKPQVAAEAAPEGEDQNEREATSRRRRRRRGRAAHGQDTETGEIEDDEQRGSAEAPSTRLPAPYAAPQTTVTYAHDRDTSNGYRSSAELDEEIGYSPYEPAPTPRTRASRPSAPAARQPESPWSMSTAQEHVQEPSSPFGSPEPSFAHGFGPQSSGVAGPLHENLPRIRRGERSSDVPMSANQLGMNITSAITQQADRLLNELRRQQYPPSMTVALPAFPSTERIGVFVDVANLLYSARSQRMSIDFGRLLDFLRGNRRLIRAHAYAPTNPDPHAEQTFLSAVKGVGYRITTKNYKTFASGARKADMDLDLCMDIVRLVDAGALDTVVLVSGDSDFLPLLEYCSDHGVRVEVAAFDDAAAMILRQSCDLFINLSQVNEIRA